MSKLVRMVSNKVPKAKDLTVPNYFYYDQRYLMLSRYPKSHKGLGIPVTFLHDLDASFCRVVALVPFQHNTELKAVLRGRSPRTQDILRRGNKSMRDLRKSQGDPDSSRRAPLVVEDTVNQTRKVNRLKRP